MEEKYWKEAEKDFVDEYLRGQVNTYGLVAYDLKELARKLLEQTEGKG